MASITNYPILFAKRFLPYVLFLAFSVLVWGIGAAEGHAQQKNVCADVTIDPTGNGYRLIITKPIVWPKGNSACIVYTQDGKLIRGQWVNNRTVEFHIPKEGQKIQVVFPTNGGKPTVTISSTIWKFDRIAVSGSCTFSNPNGNCSLSIDVPFNKRGKVTASVSLDSASRKPKGEITFVQPIGRNSNPTTLEVGIKASPGLNPVTTATAKVSGSVLLNPTTSLPYSVTASSLGCNGKLTVGGSIGVKHQFSNNFSAESGVSHDGCGLTRTAQINWGFNNRASLNVQYTRDNNNEQKIAGTVRINLP